MDPILWADSTADFDDYYRNDVRTGDDNSYHRSSSSSSRDKIGGSSPRLPSKDGGDRDSPLDEIHHRRSLSPPPQDSMGGSSSGVKESSFRGLAPTPITKEKLEASDKEKEVRKNMTTLRRNQQPAGYDPNSSRSNNNNRNAPPQSEAHSGGRSSAWAPPSSRPKNVERSRPDSTNTNNSTTATITNQNTHHKNQEKPNTMI